MDSAKEEDAKPSKKKAPTKKNAPPKKRAINKRIRLLVWNKYIGEELGIGKCFCCRVTKIDKMEFHCGHIQSRKDGGKDTVDNLRPICPSCNSSMGTNNMMDFIKEHSLHKD